MVLFKEYHIYSQIQSIHFIFPLFYFLIIDFIGIIPICLFIIALYCLHSSLTQISETDSLRRDSNLVLPRQLGLPTLFGRYKPQNALDHSVGHTSLQTSLLV